MSQLPFPPAAKPLPASTEPEIIRKSRQQHGANLLLEDVDHFLAWMTGVPTMTMEGEFTSDEMRALADWMDANQVGEDVTHRFKWGRNSPPPPEVSLAQKEAWSVFQTLDYLFIKLPNDELVLQREGFEMEHCLMVLQREYVAAMRRGEIEVYSMVDRVTNKPVVDIEVALTFTSCGHAVDYPTVSQVRGVGNQCPPADQYLGDLIKFLIWGYGQAGWAITANIENFDYKKDSILTMQRAAELGHVDVEAALLSLSPLPNRTN
jgi:hypothetical protein